MTEENPNVSYEIRVSAGKAGTDPEAPDWEVAELPTEFLEPLFKFCAALKYLTLLRSPGSNLASQRSRVKVLVRFFVGHLFH